MRWAHRDIYVAKNEMVRLTSETAAAERIIADAKVAARDLEAVLNQALLIASNCAIAYLSTDTTPGIRRQFNQGLFKALYVNIDGSIERYELTEPFGLLLDPEGVKQQLPGMGTLSAEASTQVEAAGEDRTRPSAVLIQNGNDLQETRPNGDVWAGLNNANLVRLIGALSNPDWEARRLLERATNIIKKIEMSAAHDGTAYLYQAADAKWNAWQVADRLTEEDVTALVEAYLAGTTARELAAQYGIGMTTVKRMLRERGIRKRSTATTS